MPKAKITRMGGYDCAPDGHTVINIPEGSIVDGIVAEWALADKAASAMMVRPPENKVVRDIETKGRK